MRGNGCARWPLDGSNCDGKQEIFRLNNRWLQCFCPRAAASSVRRECVTVFRTKFLRVSVGHDTMLEFISHVLLQFVQGIPGASR